MSQEKLIDVIRAFIKEEMINFNIDDDLIKLSREQALLPLLYIVSKDPKVKQYYIKAFLDSSSFDSLKAEIDLILNENNIDHIYVKGTIFKDLYPDPASRTRGDIDVYVTLDDFKRAHELLESQGFKQLEPDDCMHHIGLFKNDKEVELHFSLFDNYKGNKYATFFKSPMDLKECINAHEYKMKDTYHFIYAMCHFAGHLVYGCGLRYLIDFYYMLKKCNIDYELLHESLKKLDLTVLYDNILNGIYYITGEKFDNMKEKDIKFFIDYLAKSGVHGFGHENDRDANTFNKTGFKSYILTRIFLTNREYRIIKFPFMGKHLIFYPIMLIRQWFYLLTHKLGKLFRLLFKTKKNDNKELYKKLGI